MPTWAGFLLAALACFLLDARLNSRIPADRARTRTELNYTLTLGCLTVFFFACGVATGLDALLGLGLLAR